MPVLTLLLAVFSPRPASGAEPVTHPRILKAMENAARELTQAETRKSAADAARARAWQAALRAASAAATPEDADAVVAAARGEGRLVRSGRQALLTPGLLLREGDDLETGPDGAVEIRFHDGSSVLLSSGCALRVLQAPRSIPVEASFSLARGALHWDAPPAAQGSVAVLARGGRASLRAGSADVRVDSAGLLSLTAYEGDFALSARGGPSGSAGRRWLSALYP